jgi:WD40 repeat protein
MNKYIINLTLIASLLLSFSLAACREKPPEIVEITPSKTITLTPSPASTSTPMSTITSTPEPTSTSSTTPTATVQWDERGLSLTPIPIFNEIISQDNVNRVDLFAVWGNGKANTIALSPDGNTFAVGTGIGVYLYESLNFRTITSLPTPFSIQSIAFSPVNQLIALGQSQGTIDIYELDRESLVTRLNITGVPLNDSYKISVLFSPDGIHLTSIIETENTLYINRWRTGSWQQTSAFSVPNGFVSYLNSTAELIGIIYENQLMLQSLSIAEENQAVSLPDSQSRVFWERIPQQRGDITASTAGDFILINNGSAIVHWKLLEEDVTFRLDQYPEQLPDPCYEAPNSCRNSRGTFSWVCADSTRLPPIETIRLTPDNAQFLVSRNDNLTELYWSADGLRVWEIDAIFTEVAFSPNAEFFYGLRPNGTIEKRAILDGSLVFPLYQHPSQLTGLAFSPDGSIIAAGYTDGWIRVYSSFNGEMLGVLEGSATALQFSSNGRLLAAGLHNGTVRVYELDQGQFFDLPGGHADTVTGIAFSADGNSILTGSHDCTVSLWDLAGRFRRQNSTPGGSDPFQITAFKRVSTSGNQFLLAKENGVYQVRGSETSIFYALRNMAFSNIALSPDNRHLAVTGPSTWMFPALTVDPQGTSLELTPTINDNGYALAFTPDSALLMAAYTDGLGFWSVNDGEQLAYLPFSPPVQGSNLPVDMAVSPDGSLIALGKQDGLMYVFIVLE